MSQAQNIQCARSLMKNILSNQNKSVEVISIKQSLYCFSEMRVKDMELKRIYFFM